MIQSIPPRDSRPLLEINVQPICNWQLCLVFVQLVHLSASVYNPITGEKLVFLADDSPEVIRNSVFFVCTVVLVIIFNISQRQSCPDWQYGEFIHLTASVSKQSWSFA